MDIYEQELQYPEFYTHWGKYKIIHRDLPLANPELLKSTIHFEPKVADRIKILVNEGTEEIIAKMELLGLPNDKLYRSDPVFDPRPMESEMANLGLEYSADTINYRLQTYGVCPSGSLIVAIWIPSALAATNVYGKVYFIHKVDLIINFTLQCLD